MAICPICTMKINGSSLKNHLKSAHGIVNKQKASAKPRKTNGNVTSIIVKPKFEVSQVNHLQGLLDGKRGIKSKSIEKCFRCKKNYLEIWLYKNTIKGDIFVCSFCKYKLKGSVGNYDLIHRAFKGGFSGDK